MSILYDPTPNTPDRWLFGDERIPVTSAGLLLTTGPLEDSPYFYFVEHNDQEIEGKHPAGKVEPYEDEIESTLQRELLEETGLSLPDETSLFAVLKSYKNGYSEPSSAKLIYTGIIPFETCLKSLGEYEVNRTARLEFMISGNPYYYQNPDTFISRDGLNSEIGRRALVPTNRLFERGGPISPYYRWDIMHHIKARLEGLRVI